MTGIAILDRVNLVVVVLNVATMLRSSCCGISRMRDVVLFCFHYWFHSVESRDTKLPLQYMVAEARHRHCRVPLTEHSTQGFHVTQRSYSVLRILQWCSNQSNYTGKFHFSERTKKNTRFIA